MDVRREDEGKMTEEEKEEEDRSNSNLISFDLSDSLIKRIGVDSLKSNYSKNLFRSCKWSADGGTVLTESEDRTIRLFQYTETSSEQSTENKSVRDGLSFDGRSTDPMIDLGSSLNLPMADSVLSTSWYPYSSRNDPSRFCFVVAVKDHPIHLLDANYGSIRASYPIIDHRERVVAPHSMVFSSDGSTLYAGFDSSIEIFNISRPGEAGERYKTLPTKKSKDGQKGIISTLTLDPNRKGILAAGSFSGQIGLYDTQSSNQLNPIIVFKSSKPTGQTQVKFHPFNDQVLFSASRKSNQIECWDLRYDVRSFHEFYRPGKTNQRIKFDLDHFGSNLITGGTDGKIRIYRLDDLSKPAQCFKLSTDTISSVEFNPANYTFITCSGSRKINRSKFCNLPNESIEEENNDNDNSTEIDNNNNNNKIHSSSNQTSTTTKTFKKPLNSNPSGLSTTQTQNVAENFDFSTELCLWKFNYI